MRYHFILGAPDIEMSYIERLVRSRGHGVAYAFADGRRVHAGNAYRATTCVSEAGQTDSIVWVECAMAEAVASRELVVDHHREGDPGYGLSAERFWQGSSLGQVCDLLGEDPTQDLLMAAAADHCLGAAYQGQCPGIAPKEMRAWRSNVLARWKGVDEATLQRRVEEGIELIRRCPVMMIRGHEFVDALDGSVPELSEVSAILGVPVMYGMNDVRSGRIKVGALNGSPEALAAWMQYAEHAMHLQDVYGDPVRGYAGGYMATGVRI